MGRNRKPTDQKVIEGTFREDRANPAEPVYNSDLPDPPDHLTDGAINEWRRQLKELDDNGTLSGVDMAIYATYCEQYDRWQQAATKLKSEEYIINTGAGNKIQNPLIGISNTASREMNWAGGKCGFNPTDRSKVSAKKKKKVDPFGKFKKVK